MDNFISSEFLFVVKINSSKDYFSVYLLVVFSSYAHSRLRAYTIELHKNLYIRAFHTCTEMSFVYINVSSPRCINTYLCRLLTMS